LTGARRPPTSSCTIPRVRDRLGDDFEGNTIATHDPDIRVLIASGVLVTSIAVHAACIDDVVEVIWISVQSQEVIQVYRQCRYDRGMTMVKTSVSIPLDDLERARELGINVSELARRALRKRLDDEALDQEIDAYSAAFAEWDEAKYDHLASDGLGDD
jgi:post-segregation antitoxin (ccd killing protein)